MPYYKCDKCGAKFAGWGVGKTCDKCGGNLKEDSKEEFYEEKKKVENEIKDLN